MNDLPGTPEAGTVESVFAGRVLDVRVESVSYADGHTERLEIVRHRGAAAALPVFRPGERPDGGTSPGVLLLRQYRHSVRSWIWELPAGKLDGGETGEACAARELREEAGVTAGRLEHLVTLLTTPGFTDERIELFLATDLELVGADPEPHELIMPEMLDLDAAVEMVDAGVIGDAKTAVALLLAIRRIGDEM